MGVIAIRDGQRDGMGMRIWGDYLNTPIPKYAKKFLGVFRDFVLRQNFFFFQIFFFVLRQHFSFFGVERKVGVINPLFLVSTPSLVTPTFRFTPTKHSKFSFYAKFVFLAYFGTFFWRMGENLLNLI